MGGVNANPIIISESTFSQPNAHMIIHIVFVEPEKGWKQLYGISGNKILRDCTPW